MAFTNKKHDTDVTDKAGAVFHPVRSKSEYQGYRTGAPDQTSSITSMPILIGAASIASPAASTNARPRSGARHCARPTWQREALWDGASVSGTAGASAVFENRLVRA